MKNRIATLAPAAAGLLLALATGACTQAQTEEFLACLEDDSYMTGRINFTGTVPPQGSVPVVIEYSTDGFSTSAVGSSLSNTQGFLSAAFSFKSPCPIAASANVRFRAFQDLNGNGSWDAGEGAGREDGTSNGNTTHRSHLKSASTIGGLEVSDINIFLDSVTQ